MIYPRFATAVLAITIAFAAASSTAVLAQQPPYSVDYPIWTGNGDAVWTLNPQGPIHNWKLASNGAATDFLFGDAVVFNDSASNANVALSMGNVPPASVTFTNNTLSYVLTGTAGITGGAAMTLNGNGAVTISTSNDYYGGTILNAGLLNLGNSAALGSAAFGATLAINGGSLDNVTGGPLTIDNYPINWNGPFSFVGSNPLNIGSGGVALGMSTWQVLVASSTLTFGGPISGTGGLSKTGTGTLNLSGSCAYSGTTAINNGALRLAAGAALGNTPITVNSGATFAPQPGSSGNSAGSSGTGAAGATLNLMPGSTFSMTDGAAGAFHLSQQSAFSGTALAISGAALNFDLSNAGADVLQATGSAAVSGSNTIGVSVLGSSLNSGQTYNLVTAASGLNTGSFQFSGGGSSEVVNAGGNAYVLTLKNSASAESLTVGLNQSTGGGTSSVGGGGITLPTITTPGTASSSYYEPTSPQQVQQILQQLNAGQITFVLAGQTPQFWDISYSGAFQGEAAVTLHFDPTALGSTPLSDLRVEHFTGGSWILPPNQLIDPINNTITFTTDSFSPFALEAVPEPGTIALLGAALVVAIGAWARHWVRLMR